MMDYGFVEFYDEKDKMAKNFFKEANNRDFLGLRKMNIRISNVLFPFGNTLMPNLVYFYYLNAIYHAYKELTGKKPTKSVIDKYETWISQRICKYESEKNLKPKGFLNTANSRAYGRYKSNMERMHFFEEGWKAHEKHEKTALKCLQKTARYQFVRDVIEVNMEKTLVEEFSFPDEWMCDGVEWARKDIQFKPDKLEDAERLDFIRRVVQLYMEETPEYSVFTNVVMYYAMMKRKPTYNSKIYGDEWMERYNDKRTKTIDNKIEIKDKNGTVVESYDFKGIKTFEELEGYFKYIEEGLPCDGKGRAISKKNRKVDYTIAQSYSKLQLIEKLAYNVCLFQEFEHISQYMNERVTEDCIKQMPDIEKSYLKSLRKELCDIRKSGVWKPMEKYHDIKKMPKDKEDNIFLGNKPGDPNHDAELEGAFAFIGGIARCIKEDCDNPDEKALIEKIIKLVKEREQEIMGDDSLLNSGIRAEAGPNYVDTFRWQYRPEHAHEEAAEYGDDIIEEELSKNEEASEKKTYIWKLGEPTKDLQTMSASYYIYELFFEPYEKLKG